MNDSGLVTREGQKIPLLGVKVLGEVVADKAHVTVRQRYRNDERRPVEAIYTFPLPSDATLVGFAMTCAGRRLDGVVKEREDAFRAYDDALVAGHGAALLDQERPNVFTASVGNLLPGEETIVEVVYVQRLASDEGAVRWSIPTLVAPRYIPGAPAGDRTGHGVSDPTDLVPDADRITPRIGEVAYGLELDVRFDLGAHLTVDSPSHRITTSDEGNSTRVRFLQGDVALDRDVVLVARGAGENLTSVAIHAGAGTEPGTLALSVVPDLGARGAAPRQDIVFVIDTSGSMEGASLVEAQAALRLCLRHLREGDRFGIISFASKHVAFEPALVPFTQKTLEKADRWVRGLTASGGTELLAPLLAATQLSPNGVVVLLTDGQVGNEDQILAEVLAAREKARIYTFGIGTNVSDALLRDLAKRTGGALEMIHPGERIDEKVVAQFARAVAPRVTDVSVSFGGLEVGELAPSELPALVDGEPWALFGRVSGRARGRAELRGKLDGQPFFLAVEIDPEVYGERPVLTKLWAAERVRDLEAMDVTGRRAGRMKERIVELAVRHGIASRYTSFVVVEERQGDRRASGFPEARPIPVNLPAGWDMFKRRAEPMQVSAMRPTMRTMAGMAPPPGMPSPMVAMGAAPPPPQSAAPADMRTRAGGAVADFFSKAKDIASFIAPSPKKAASPASLREQVAGKSGSAPEEPGIAVLLGKQLASGLWDDDGAARDDAARVRATARVLVALERDGITTAHALYGAQVKKAVGALLALADTLLARDRPGAEIAVCAASLVATGRRTRGEVDRRLAALGLDSEDPAALRARLAQV